MKWPIIQKGEEGSVNVIKTEYLTKIVEMLLDKESCTVCQQCVRVCPKGAWELPKIPKGVRVPRSERVPIMPDPLKCKFCGICMVMCPYNSISMREDGQLKKLEELPLITAKKLPSFEKLRVGKFELREPDFSSDLWTKVVDRITIKRKAKTS